MKKRSWEVHSIVPVSFMKLSTQVPDAPNSPLTAPSHSKPAGQLEASEHVCGSHVPLPIPMKDKMGRLHVKPTSHSESSEQVAPREVLVALLAVMLVFSRAKHRLQFAPRAAAVSFSVDMHMLQLIGGHQLQGGAEAFVKFKHALQFNSIMDTLPCAS